MRVIEVIRGLGLGGSESQLVQRLEYVQRHPELDIETLAVVNAYSGEQFFAERLRAMGVLVDDIGTLGRWSSFIRVWRRARDFPSDVVVVVHSPWPALALKLRKMLGLMPQRLVEVASSTRYARPMLWAAALFNRFADVHIAVSEDVAHAPTTRGAKRTEVIHAGVDREVMRDWIIEHPLAPEEFRARLGIDVNARLLAMIGNLYDFKGQDLAVRAIEPIGDLNLVLVGDGPENKRLRQLARTLGVQGRVHLVGREADAWRWAATADVVVHSSRLEGLPVALIEARVLGTPVVATDVGGIRAVLASDPASRVVAAGDHEALVAALKMALAAVPDIRSAFAQRALEANEWDVARFARDFYGVASASTP